MGPGARVSRRVALQVLGGAGGFAQSPCQSSDLVVTGARALGGRRANHEIVISAGRVAAAGRAGTLKRPRGCRVLQARGDTLLPGLIDAHVHLYELGGPSAQQMYSAPRENSFPITCRQLLRSGVTTARVHLFDSVHGPALKRDSLDDCYPAPRFQIGGPGIIGGRPELNGAYATGYRDLNDARAKLRAMRGAGADWVALHALASFPAGELQAIVDAARGAGLRVMAEGDPASNAERALGIGADSIEYLDRTDGAGYSAELTAKLAHSPTIVVAPIGYYNRIVAIRREPSLLKADHLTEFMPAAVAEDVRRRWDEWSGKPHPIERVVAKVNERFLQLTRAGVKIAAGTDCGSPGSVQADAIWWEMETRRKLGLPVESAFASATTVAAELLRLSDVGHLRPGARGDFVLYQGDVSEGTLDVQRVRAVGKGGVLFVDEYKWAGPAFVTAE